MLLFRLLSIFFCFYFFTATADEGVGTLLVSYSTGEKAERLDRIRFSLISDDNEEQLYPKGDAFIEGSDSESRLIVVENLPAGTYKLRFLIPNSDKLFEEVPERLVTITENEVVRIDQQCFPRYSTIKVKTETLPEGYTPEKNPEITLIDSHGSDCAHSTSGRLTAHSLIPGKYLVKFGELRGYHAPETLSLDINPGHVIGPLIGTYIWEGLSSRQNDSNHVAVSIIDRRPSGVVIINNYNAQLSVTSNQPEARWTLLRNEVPVYEGVGSVINFQVLDGDNYRVVPEPLQGYTVRVSPASSFPLYVGQPMRVAIAYERSISAFSVQGKLPVGETLTINVRSREVPPFSQTIKSTTGKIFWQSRPLPTGYYEVSYELPPNYEPITPDRILLKPGEKIQLSPKLVVKKALRIIANIPEAIFLLTPLNSTKVLKGEGREYTFTDIPTGTYRLTFSTGNPDFFIPPKEMRVIYNDKETKEIKVFYQVAGKLTVRTNIDRSNADIQEIGGKHANFQETILNHSKSFNLPEGRYRITLSTIPEDKGTTANLFPPEPVEVMVRAMTSEEINLNFTLNTPAEKQRRVTINTGQSAAGYTIYQLNRNGKEQVGRYSGKNVQVTLPASDLYEVVYDDIPNFQKPENATIEIKAGEEKTIQAIYQPIQSLIEIPEGKAIIGDAAPGEKTNELPAKIVFLDAFSIGVYEVTNAEYASWLNSAIKSGTIAYIKEADKRGQVVNLKDQLLFKSFEADSYSQISAQLQSGGSPTFMPIGGKDSHPVINVTWYGAMEYCKDNKSRLPTEAEWEKAAGMEPESKGVGLKKYRYGFGRNEIDPTWANYRVNDDRIQHFQVLTTPIGFYDGVNYLPLSVRASSQQQTNLAKSPYGAFDMSGNVWEWVSDWFDESYSTKMAETNPQGPSKGTKKVVKGGSYDSLSDGVRVAERLGLEPGYCDGYTGFRIAK